MGLFLCPTIFTAPMLEVQRIRQDKDQLAAALAKRGITDGAALLDAVITADDARKNTQAQTDQIQAQIKSLSKEIGSLFKNGQAAEAEASKAKVADLKESLNGLKAQADQAEGDLRNALLQIPNVPHESVPTGNSEAENITVFESDLKNAAISNAKPHWELADAYGLIDFELGVKVTGAGFPIYKGKGARLQRGLIQFFLDEAHGAGYEEIIPPHVVNEASGYGTGQLPDKEGQMYHITEDNLYLIPTAEVPLTNLYRDALIKDTDALPIKICGYTPCFRREAGSYGKDVRGLNRLHQFDKVEIVRVELPENSASALEDMKNHVARLLEKLGLQYRILRLCGGDLGFASALTYDFEVYSAAQERWLEVSSVSNFETFQANRLKLRYKNIEGKNTLLHTLNGSALALPRIVAALLENHQDEQGIAMPEALHKYLGFDRI